MSIQCHQNKWSLVLAHKHTTPFFQLMFIVTVSLAAHCVCLLVLYSPFAHVSAQLFFPTIIRRQLRPYVMSVLWHGVVPSVPGKQLLPSLYRTCQKLAAIRLHNCLPAQLWHLQVPFPYQYLPRGNIDLPQPQSLWVPLWLPLRRVIPFRNNLTSRTSFWVICHIPI